MVWIHGGGWSMGSPEETDPTALGFFSNFSNEKYSK